MRCDAGGGWKGVAVQQWRNTHLLAGETRTAQRKEEISTSVLLLRGPNEEHAQFCGLVMMMKQ